MRWPGRFRAGISIHNPCARTLHSNTRNLHVERLEPRLVFAANPLADYAHVNQAWFATHDIASDLADASSTETPATPNEHWIVRLTPAATEAITDVAAAADVLQQIGAPLLTIRGLGLPG